MEDSIFECQRGLSREWIGGNWDLMEGVGSMGNRFHLEPPNSLSIVSKSNKSRCGGVGHSVILAAAMHDRPNGQGSLDASA